MKLNVFKSMDYLVDNSRVVGSRVPQLDQLIISGGLFSPEKSHVLGLQIPKLRRYVYNHLIYKNTSTT